MLTSLASSSHLLLRKEFACRESPNVDSAPGAPHTSHPLACEAAPQRAVSRTRLAACPPTFLSPVFLTSVDGPAVPPRGSLRDPLARRLSTSSSSPFPPLSGPGASRHPTAAHLADLPPPAPMAPAVCCPPRGSWTEPTMWLAGWLTPRAFLPHCGRPTGPLGQAQAVAPPVATTPCSSPASRHPLLASWPWDAFLMPRCTQCTSSSVPGVARPAASASTAPATLTTQREAVHSPAAQVSWCFRGSACM